MTYGPWEGLDSYFVIYFVTRKSQTGRSPLTFCQETQLSTTPLVFGPFLPVPTSPPYARPKNLCSSPLSDITSNVDSWLVLLPDRRHFREDPLVVHGSKINVHHEWCYHNGQCKATWIGRRSLVHRGLPFLGD